MPLKQEWKQQLVDTERKCKYMRKTMLFVPGNNPAMVQNAGILGASTIIFDLEDAVAQDEKDAARNLLKNALESIEFEKCQRTVRINALDTAHWENDISSLASSGVDGFVVPKVERAADMQRVDELLEKEFPGNELYLIPLIESALGVENVFEILKASKKIVAVFFGGEDYTANTGALRTKEGKEIFYARNRIVNAATACMVEAIDTPFTDVNDLTGLERDVMTAKELGFSGKAAISPNHCSIIQNGFYPTEKEISYAKDVIEVAERASVEGKGVISLYGKMIDKPIVLRAIKVLKSVGMECDFTYE